MNNKIVNTNPEIKEIGIKQNRNFPNSPHPVLIYRNACLLGKQKNKAAEILQGVFNKNNWKNAWRNGIYNFHHYHSNTHECLGIASGSVKVVFGGPGGRGVTMKKGDVVIIPGGVGHKCTAASKDFLCVGAYPGGKQYDINLGTHAEFVASKARLAKLTVPAKDPVFGKEGFLKTFWK